MIGAIIGDIVGSRFQFKNHKGKDFMFFHHTCVPTDDSFMTLAIAKAFILHKDWTDIEGLKNTTIRCMKEVGNDHKNTGWGGMFYKWLFESSVPYNSYGNGAGMRVSPVGWVADSPEQVKILSKAVTEISHNHPEGLKGAEAIAMATYLARTGVNKEDIKKIMIKDYYPELKYMNIESLISEYELDDFGKWVTCQGSIPQALTAFFDSENFEDAIRNAIAMGGDADTIGCMTGAVAEAYYGVSYEMEDKALEYLTDDLKTIYSAFYTIRKKRVVKK